MKLPSLPPLHTIPHLLIIATPIVIFFYLLNINLVPTGIFTVERAVNQTSPYLERLLPDGRVEAAEVGTHGDWFQKIIGDPVFFFVHPQRFFPQVKTEIRFQNTGVPIVEFGLLADAVTGAYDLKPLQNLIIDNSIWSRIEVGGRVLLQREKKFDSLEEFLSALPDRSEIATYHFNLSEPYRLSNYVPSLATIEQEIALRGSHEFYTYIKNEILNFRFYFNDENRLVGADEVNIVVINEDGLPVAESKFSDKTTFVDGSTSFPLSTEIIIVDLPEGVYKIQMKATDDIVFRAISTTQQKMTFLNHLWFSDVEDYPSDFSPNLVSGGKNFRLSTRYASAAQTVWFGNSELAVSEPYLEYLFEAATDGLSEIFVSKNDDLMIRADGYFSFSPDQYFNPDPVRLTAETNLDRAGINYIVAEYTSPRNNGEWFIAEADLQTVGAPFENKTWKFVISAPTATKDERELLVNSIKMTFSGSPLTFQKIWDKLSYVWE